jgi:glycosyltransferase involved in cell wall biosynthesis
MRVALLHYTAPPTAGGVERVLARHARLLADAGHQVTVVVGRGRRPDERVQVRRVPRVDTGHPAVHAVQAALDAGTVPAGFGPLQAALEAQVAEAAGDADVLIAHNVCSLPKNLALTAALHRLNGTPHFPRLIAWHHDIAWTTERYRAVLHPGQPWDLLRTAWPGVAHVAVSAERQAALASLLDLDPVVITLVENGVDREAFLGLGRRTSALLEPLDLGGAGPILLLPVRIAPHKNIELALSVLAALRVQGDDARLLVTGPPDPHSPGAEAYLEQLLRLRADLDLGRAAHFLSEDGHTLSDRVVAELYRVADALLLPSRDEGFGLPILEAAVSRLPVFCTDLPSVRAIAGQAATYFSADDEPARVARLVLRRLAADPAYALALRARRHYDWRQILRERIDPLLEQVVAGGP